MKKKILMVIGLVLLLAAPGWSAITFDGSGSYADWSALEAGEAVSGSSIVDGSGTTYTDQWLPVEGSGTDADNPLIIQDATLNGAISYGILDITNDFSYITIKDITLSNFTNRGIYIIGQGSDWVFDGLHVTSDATVANESVIIKGDGSGTEISNITIQNSYFEDSGTNEQLLRFEYVAGFLRLYNNILTDADVQGAWFADIVADVDIQRSFGIANGSRTWYFVSGSGDINMLDSGADGGSGSGLYVESGWTGGLYGTGISINNTSSLDDANIIINADLANDSYISGTFTSPAAGDNFKFGDGAGDLEIRDSYIAFAKDDNVGGSPDGGSGGSFNITINRSTLAYAGKIGEIASGDGFSPHDGTGFLTKFSFYTGNWKAGVAFDGTSSGQVINNTFMYNQSQTHLVFQAEISILDATARFEIRNNVACHDDSSVTVSAQRELIQFNEFVNPTSDGSTSTISNNAYITVAKDDECFTVSGTGYDFEAYIAAGISATDTNFESGSILFVKNGTSYDYYRASAPGTLAGTITYRPIDSDGRIVNASDNPLKNGGVAVTGVTDGSATDIDGNSINGLPDIGCSEIPSSGGGGSNIISIGGGFGIQ